MKKALIAVLLLTALLLSACGPAAPEADPAKPHATVSFSYEEGLKYAPSYAIWVVDEAGNSATLFATAKVATGLKNRPATLPVWSGVRGGADITSGATPSDKAELTLNIPDDFAGKKLALFIEANASYDYNDYYAEGLDEGAEGYNDVNGQPSAVWTAVLDTAQASGSASPDLIGAGEVTGADHELHEADRLTVPVLKGIEVTWDMGA